MENVALLRKFFLFELLSGIELVQMSRIVTRHSYPRGTTILEEGTVGDSLYIVKSGRVRVTKKDPRGRTVTLAVLDRGDHLGEVSLFDRGPRSASVLAEENCEILEITGRDLERLLSSNVNMATKLYKNFIIALCRRLRTTNILFSEQKGKAVRHEIF